MFQTAHWTGLQEYCSPGSNRPFGSQSEGFRSIDRGWTKAENDSILLVAGTAAGDQRALVSAALLLLDEPTKFGFRDDHK
jgi:hypothetical protein